MLRVTGPADNLQDDQRYCTCCNRRLKRRIAWLELDQRVNLYHDEGGVPEEHSQGWFPFGLTCARNIKTATLALPRYQQLLAPATPQRQD